MEQEATYRGTVYPWQCDHVGHMNIMWYVGKFDEANWNLFARIGLTPTYLRESGRGMAAVQQNITYKRELLAGDIVEVKSELLEIGVKSIRFMHQMRNAETGEIAATCEITAVHMDRQARKSAPFADTIRRFRRAVDRLSRGGQRMSSPRFEPKNPDYRAVATATFDSQQAMRTLGISIARLEAGEVDLAMPYSQAWTQQNGFVHAGIITAGLDTACGIAAFTLMPVNSDILTVEFKTNLLAPAKGERFVFRARVVKPGRTLTVCEARAFAEHEGAENLIATMTGTLMALPRRG
jgi:acyl-CoA thioester hydrolase